MEQHCLLHSANCECKKKFAGAAAFSQPTSGAPHRPSRGRYASRSLLATRPGRSMRGTRSIRGVACCSANSSSCSSTTSGHIDGSEAGAAGGSSGDFTQGFTSSESPGPIDGRIDGRFNSNSNLNSNAINEIEKQNTYKFKKILATKQRGYAIAYKI